MSGVLSPKRGISADGVIGVPFSPDGSRLVWTSEDGTVEVCDVATGRGRLRVVLGARAFPAVFSADGSLLLTARRDGEIRVLDAESGTQLGQVRIGEGVEGVTWAPDGSWVAVADAQYGVQVWDIHLGKRRWQRNDHSQWIMQMLASPDGTTLATASWDDTSRGYDIVTGRELWHLQLEGDAWSVAFSPDSATVAVSGADPRAVQVLDARTGQPRWHLDADGFVFGVQFSPDGRSLFVDCGFLVVHGPSGSESPRVAWLLDAATGEELSIIIYAGHVRAVSFRPGSAWVLFDETGDGQSMRIVDIKTGWECGRLPPCTEGWGSADFSPDGALLAAIGKDGVGQLFDLTAALRELPQTGPTGPRQPSFERPNASPVADHGPVIYHLQGTRIADLDAFWVELGAAVNGPGGFFGRSLDGLNDCLRGGFGTPDDGDFLIVWNHHELSRERLGYPETCRQLERRLARCHPLNDVIVQADLDAARAGNGPTAFDWIIDIFDLHPGHLVLR